MYDFRNVWSHQWRIWGGKAGGGGLRGVRMHTPPLRILSALFGMLNAFFTHYSILKP